MNRNTVQDLSTITMQEPINMESLQVVFNSRSFGYVLSKRCIHLTFKL